MTTDQVEATKKLDRAFILAVENWPRWPALPLKRYPKGASMPEFGILLDNQPPTISDAELQFPNRVLLGSGVFYGEKPDGEIVYDTVDALLADGWMVD